jgi:hypothetical protein
VRLGGTSRNNTNHFFIFSPVKRVYDKQNRARSDGSDGYPALLVLECVVAPRDGVRIVENERRSFEANIVLPKVLPILALIPFELHRQSATTAA